MSFFKNIFKKPTQERKLNNVEDLTLGDIIVMSDSFGLPTALRAQEFQVSAVNSYEFEHKTQIEWVLLGGNDVELYLTLDVDDKIYLKFSLKILHQDVESLFDLDQFSEIFDEPGQAQLTRLVDSENSSGWSSELYQQSSFAQVGYFHRKDYRKDALSAYEGKDSGEQFELYSLFNEDQDKGIDVEVWQDGDTEVFLTLFKPTTDIVDMYPGS
ncbi:hypothetical protein [Cognaticolwellia aestuarii]|uniref:hypothetical protein n=1 Tax=Cognaticolwellia aestuarii TaxID=329993 RepID=UPI0009845D03|nr:hypothetical protein [Cognaticolwellia aestuarii]